MNSERAKLQVKGKQEQTIEFKGTLFKIDLSSIIYRDAQMNAIYACRKISKNSQQPISLCIKQYSSESEKEEIISQWNHIKAIQKRQVSRSYANLFQDFIQAKNNKHYLVMKQFRQTLLDKHQFGCKNLKYQLLMQKVQRFSIDISNLLLALHKQENGQKCFILTTLNPLYLANQQKGSFLLTNFSNLIQASSKMHTDFSLRKGHGVGYYSPEMIQGKICPKSNIWSFGCILFEILANGQKLIQSEEYYCKIGTQQLKNYLERRIMYCQYRLEKLQDNPNQKKNFWLKIAEKCLQVDISNRYSSQQLNNFVLNSIKENEWGRVKQSQLSLLKARTSYELSFQCYRANLLQDKIFAIFDEIYKMEPNGNKYIIYIALKFIATFFLEKYQISRQKAQIFASKLEIQDHYSQLLGINQWKKIKEIKDKISQKIIKFMQTQERQFQYQTSKRETPQSFQKGGQHYIQNNQPISDEVGVLFDKKFLRDDIKVAFVEYKDRKISDIQYLLGAFCHKYRQILQQNKKIHSILAQVLLYTRSLVDYEILACKQVELKQNVQVLALKKMYPFFTDCQKQAQKDAKGIIASFYQISCKVNRILPRRMSQIKKNP